MSKRFYINLKALMIVEIIISYMALLTVVSHIRAPQEYRVETESPILVTSDFVSFFGEQAGDTLSYNNDTDGTAIGYVGELELTDLEQIFVSFRIACPSEYAGKTVYVDLYDYEGGYDSPEQEEVLTLQQGEYEVEFSLFPGENPPTSAQLRIFTVEAADYLIDNVTICAVKPLPKVSNAMIYTVCLIWLCTLLTAGYRLRKWWKEGGNPDE